MGFQIVNKDKEAISLNDLDKEAADFWKKELLPKSYSSPQVGFSNWFDAIGWSIDTMRYTSSGWEEVKCRMMQLLTCDFALIKEEEQIIRLKKANKYLKPYFDLIDFWISLGYEPLKVK